MSDIDKKTLSKEEFIKNFCDNCNFKFQCDTPCQSRLCPELKIVEETWKACQSRFLDNADDWLNEHIQTDDEVEMVDEYNPSASSFIQEMKHRLEVATEIIHQFNKEMEERQ